MRSEWRRFWMEEDGIGVVEIILILVVLVAVIVIFREQITNMINSAFDKLDSGTKTISGDIKIKED